MTSKIERAIGTMAQSLSNFLEEEIYFLSRGNIKSDKAPKINGSLSALQDLTTNTMKPLLGSGLTSGTITDFCILRNTPEKFSKV